MKHLIKQLQLNSFQGAMIGVEKESLRIKRKGVISETSHPPALGSPLTHPCITTDFSEALLELITPPCKSSRDALDFLADTETFVHQQLRNEYMWSASMPCLLRGEEDIPIARYGHSSTGMMKTVYRRGLAHRYGKKMQVIAGAHFNYSFPTSLLTEMQQAENNQGPISLYINQKYMAMIRNMQRYGWLNLYLFGASPAICHSFAETKPDKLSHFDNRTYFHPYATSLRMSDIGYTNNNMHRNIKVSYDSIEAYIRTLGAVINTPHPAYDGIGKNRSDGLQQLNSNILQIENEYYTTVRPKQIPQDDESHFKALQERGIRYVEVRSLDINPFSPSGLDQSQLNFMEVIMHYCLLKDSPMINDHESNTIKQNLNQVAYEGRNPKLQLQCGNGSIHMQQWALDIMDEMQSISQTLDAAHDTLRYSRALCEQREKIINPALTPSARILSDMHEHEESFTEFAMRKSREHHKYHQSRKLSQRRREYYESLSRKSYRQQQELERSDTCRQLGDQLLISSVTA